MERLCFTLLLLFVFSLPFENMYVVEGLGTITKLIGFPFFILSTFLIIKRGYVKKLSYYHLIIISFCIFGILSFFWSINPSSSVKSISTLIQLTILLIYISQVINNFSMLVKLLQAYVLGSTYVIIATFSSYINNLGVNGTRFSPVGFDPNELGITIVLALVIAWYLSLIIKNKFFFLFNRFIVLTGMFAVLLTGSRTALIALLVSGIYMLFTTKPTKRKTRIVIYIARIVLILIIIRTAIHYLPESTVERLMTTSNEIQQGGLNNRGIIWEAGFSIFKEHPLVGVGIGAFPSALYEKIGLNMVAHNVYVSISAELGLVGFFIWIMITISSLIVIYRLNSAERNFYLSLLVVLIIGSLTLSWEYSKITWLIFSCLASMNALHICKHKKDY
ncbi:O-antigen ligase family protein [Bacillus sp. ISL-4]|uniref:O-antigen ligase family protein n=1 Tax=Bacillus sp. ISL-4 TaxID=2819125 RepID=UPI001BED257A|nr:O-antigen ligase family protein [Bacillus sp. ISL-4]MBT2667489.1 O-antigen ligase family protein [Bacillus sp. ISL-4]MBT2672972.1 O-antigen ligase family protein [Streptomyces sp. ISL-14]